MDWLVVLGLGVAVLESVWDERPYREFRGWR